MNESEDSINPESWMKVDGNLAVKMKPKKRSLVERELETNLTARVTSPVTIGDGTSTSRYGRARRLKTESESSDSKKIMLEVLKIPQSEKSPNKLQPPAYKMHASNSPIRAISPKKAPVETSLENQIENIYQENISLSRFNKDEIIKNSPYKNQKIYVQKDLIQSREPEETVVLIKNIFSPVKGRDKSTNTHLSNILERSSDKFNITTKDKQQIDFIDNSSVVKTLDFDNKRKRKENKDIKYPSKNDLFEMEAKCVYQVGDLAWSRMGTYPFWPCIVTRDPTTGTYVKKKLFGRIERDIIHVTFFGDNGRRGWIVDSMLRKFMGLAEFESTRDKFTAEDKKKDPRLYGAFFISDKKQLLWHISVEEAETLLREPKRLRIELLNDILEKSRSYKINPKAPKSGKVTRTDSDVSLSESLYDTLFSEDDGKTDDSDRLKNKSRNKSLDVSEVVTACLDNMAAKTGITKIQRQSHMDRWLQKAKSKTPEKTHVKSQVPKVVVDNKMYNSKKRKSHKEAKPYNLRKPPYESHNLLAYHNEHDYSKFVSDDDNSSIKTSISDGVIENKYEFVPLEESGAGIGVITKIESLADDKEQSDEFEASKNDGYIVTSNKHAKDVVFENAVIKLHERETRNIESDQSDKINIVKNKEIDINYDNSDDQQVNECAILQENKDACCDTNCLETDSTFNHNSYLEDSGLQNISNNSETNNEDSMEIENINDNDMINSSDILDKSNLSIDKNNVSMVDSEMSIDTENHDTTAEGPNLYSEKSEVIDFRKEELNDSFVANVPIDKESTLNKGDNIILDLKLLQKNNCDEMNINTEDFFLYQTESAFLHSIKSTNEDKLEDTNNININYLLEDTKINRNSNLNLVSKGNFMNNDNEIFKQIEVDKLCHLDDQIDNLKAEKVYGRIRTTRETCGKYTNMRQRKKNKTKVHPEESLNVNKLDENEKGKNKSADSNKATDNIVEKPAIKIILNENSFGNLKDTNCVEENKIDREESLSMNRFQETGTNYFEGSNDDRDNVFINSEVTSKKKYQLQSEHSQNRTNELNNPEFLKYLELRQDAVMDEHPELDQDNIIAYLYQTWIYKENKKTDNKKANHLKLSSSVKDLDNQIRKKRSRRLKGLDTEDKKNKSTAERSNQGSDSEPVTSDSIENSVKFNLRSKKPIALVKKNLSLKRNNKRETPVSMKSFFDIKKDSTVNLSESNKSNLEISCNSEIELTTNSIYNTVIHNVNEKESEITCTSVDNINKDKVYPILLNLLTDSISSTVDNDSEVTSKIKEDISNADNILEASEEKSESYESFSSVDLETRLIQSEGKPGNDTKIITMMQASDSPEVSTGESESDNVSFNSTISEARLTKSKQKTKQNREAINILDESLETTKETFESHKDSVILTNSEKNMTESEEKPAHDTKMITMIQDGPEASKEESDTNNDSFNSIDSDTKLTKRKHKRKRNRKIINTLDVSLETGKEKSERNNDSVNSSNVETSLTKTEEKPRYGLKMIIKIPYSPEASKVESEINNDSFNSTNSERRLSKPKQKSKRNRKTINTLDVSLEDDKEISERNTDSVNSSNLEISLTKSEDQSGPDTSIIIKLPDSSEASKEESESNNDNITNLETSFTKYDENHVHDTKIIMKEPDSPEGSKEESENNKDSFNSADSETRLTKSKQETKCNKATSNTLDVSLETNKEESESTVDSVNITNVETSLTKPKETPGYDTNMIIKRPYSPEAGKDESESNNDSSNSTDSETRLTEPKPKTKDNIETSNTLDACLETDNEKSERNNDSDISNLEMVVTKPKQKSKYLKRTTNPFDDPEFQKYQELRQDALIEENPQLTQEEITNYLYKTWIYEENSKSDLKKTDDIAQSSLVKGLEQEIVPTKKIKKKVKVPKDITDYFEVSPKEKPKRKSIKPYYNEDFYDLEDENECYELNSDGTSAMKTETEYTEQGNDQHLEDNQVYQIEEEVDEAEVYFSELTRPKPNIFKGLIREKVCEICENTGVLVKCKACHGMFHADCVQTESKAVEITTPIRGRRKKKKSGRKPKNSEDSEGHSDDKQDISEDNNISIEEIEAESITVDAVEFEKQLFEKMKEILENTEAVDYDSYSSDNELDWNNTIAGKCEIVDVKLKRRSSDAYVDYSDFKCNHCLKDDTPVCFVCKSDVSKKESKLRQRCHVPHCHKYYHLECLDHWPQTQFNAGEPSKYNKKINEHFESLACPRHVCHTCVSDDPRGCKTRFSGDKLARCVRCPATYHSFTKCVPAGSQILSASHIICPRHYKHRPGKVPCHVNTGWCFICALGGSLICCEYCPTSFHAECLNIDPPEGGYMCEDCETGRLPLYGEMVWVKLGHYRWWPGLILHPSEIPHNIMAVKHSQGEFVVRFFGQYDYYWVNRGRVFPFQEGDSGRVSSQKSKIDAAFTTAMEHAQRACEVLKSAIPNQEESLDIASSLLPPHYVKLRVNKPCGSLCGRRLDDPELSLTQCDCNPDEEDPCGPYSQCLNRMLLTECGPSCRAGDRCNNRAFEKRLYPKLVPYRTPHRGWGLKTLEDIKAGQFVIEYVGELIDEEEFKRRMRRKHEIRDENFYFLTLDKERMIDAGPKGNLARFMNHCCEPNCETQKWTVLGDVRVGLFALYDIPANSEVTFNYNLESAGIEKKRCMCGAKRCSGYIGAKPKQDDPQAKKGKVPVKRAYKKRKVEESPSTGKTKSKRLGRPPKPKELSEIEKDLLIIRNATNGLSSDESTRSLGSDGDGIPKPLKRKRVSFSTEEVVPFESTESPGAKRQKYNETEVGD